MPTRPGEAIQTDEIPGFLRKQALKPQGQFGQAKAYPAGRMVCIFCIAADLTRLLNL